MTDKTKWRESEWRERKREGGWGEREIPMTKMTLTFPPRRRTKKENNLHGYDNQYKEKHN